MPHAEVTQVAFAGGHAVGDLAQRPRPAKITELHCDELAPAGQARGVLLTLACHGLIE